MMESTWSRSSFLPHRHLKPSHRRERHRHRPNDTDVMQ